jgi:hypothetical protein
MVGATFTVAAVAEVIRAKKSITAVGNAQVSTAQSKFGGASAYFDGTDDQLIATGDFSQAGDCTFECWFRPNRVTGIQILMAIGNENPERAAVYLDGTALKYDTYGGGGTPKFTCSGTYSSSTWYHLAVVRSGTTVRVYIDGTSVGTGTKSGTLGNANNIHFGSITADANDYQGWIDEMRVSNTARYTATFTPSTTPFVNDANTLLLIHCDGTDKTPFFEDDNGVRLAKSITAFGNAQVSTAQSQFGGASALFDGTGDYLLSPTNSNFGFGTGNFTIEGWIRFNNFTSGPVFVDMRSAGGTEVVPTIYFNTSGAPIYYTNGSARITGSDLSTGTWHHIAVSRSGTSTRMFVNGTQVGSTYTDSNNYVTTLLSIGIVPYNTAFGALNGWMDEIRVSNSARYTSNFTPSTTPFVNDANTLLLIHADGTDATTVFRDDVGVRSPKGITAVGNAQVDTAQSQFGGASALFDGTGDYLTVDNTGFLFQAGESVTMECWIRLASTAAEYYGIMSLGSSRGASSNEYYVFLRNNTETGNVHKVKVGTDFSDVIIGTTQIVVNTWYHVAVVRNGNNYTLYVNGTAEGTNTSRTDVLGQNTGMKVGALADGSLVWNGHLDEVRVSNSARYTANFTPSGPFVNDANTLLLIHADGTDASTVFQDDNGVRLSKGVLAIGNAQVDTAQSQFGGSSALFDGTGDYLIVNPTFDLGSSNFTMEAWIRTTVQNERIILAKYTFAFPTGFDWTFNLSATGKIIFQWYDGAFKFVAGATTISTNTWHHVSVVRNGSSLKLYLNGTEDGSGTATDIRAGTAGIWVGAYQESTPASSWNGHLDEIRVSNTARYTADFTAPTSPFVNDANTLLLIHADGANASTEFFDDAPGALSSVTAMLPVDAVTATASTITIPTWALADDYAVLFDYSTTTTLTVPSGWTQITTSTTTGIRSTVSYKKLVSGDINTSITGMGGTTRKVLVIVRGNAPISSVTLSTPAQQATTAAPTNQTISMSGSIAPVMGFAHYTSTGAVATRTGTGNLREFTSATNQYVKVWAYTPAQSTNITVGQSDNGTNALQSFWIRFNP